MSDMRVQLVHDELSYRLVFGIQELLVHDVLSCELVLVHGKLVRVRDRLVLVYGKRVQEQSKRVLVLGERMLVRGEGVQEHDKRVLVRDERVLLLGERVLVRGKRVLVRGERVLEHDKWVLVRCKQTGLLYGELEQLVQHKLVHEETSLFYVTVLQLVCIQAWHEHKEEVVQHMRLASELEENNNFELVLHEKLKFV